jgi:hypothetical protein
MVKAARPDTLIERVDQLADVYGEVLLGLYDELTDQRERTEAVAARADAVLTEARRLMDDMGAVAAQVRILEQQTTEAAASIPVPTGVAPDANTVVDPDTAARTSEALARLAALETTAATLETSVQERMDAAVARCETVTAGMRDDVRTQIEQSVADIHTEMQGSITELRQHVRDLVDAVTLETQEASQRAQRAEASAVAAADAAATAASATAVEGAAPAPVELPDTAQLADDVRREASATIADEVRREAVDRVAEELERQRQLLPPPPVAEVAAIDTHAIDTHATERLVEQLRAEMEARTSHLAAGAQRAEELSLRLDQLVSDAQSQMHDAKTDRAAAAFALRESRAELDAAKRALEMTDYAGAVDRLRRTEMFLYATAMIAVVAIALALWALLK